MRIKIKAKEIEGKLVIYLEDEQEFSAMFKHNGVYVGVSTEPKLNHTYVMKGSILLSVADGDQVLIGKQFTPWTFTKLSFDRWEATHTSFKSKIIKNNKEYLFAVSSGAARNGIFHNIQREENKLGA